MSPIWDKEKKPVSDGKQTNDLPYTAPFIVDLIAEKNKSTTVVLFPKNWSTSKEV